MAGQTVASPKDISTGVGSNDPDRDDLESFELEASSGRSQEDIDEQHRQQITAGNLGLQRILLPEGTTKGQAIALLSRQIPLNEYSLPTFFYRSDFLPHDLGLLSQNDVDAAGVSLDYTEGYPVYGQASIFWNQLPHEAYADHVLFQRYLEQAEKIGLRQLQTLAMEEVVTQERIAELAMQYCWSWRARAFDFFQVAADRKRREIRRTKTEDNHFVLASGLLDKLVAKFQDEEDPYKNMTAKETIECMRLLVNIQRISMGVSQNGNQGNAVVDPMAGASGSDLMDAITKNHKGGAEGTGITNNLLILLQDPNFARNAQSLVLQVRGSGDHQELNLRPIADD